MSILDQFGKDSVLNRLARGPVLEPPAKRNKPPRFRCDRCGCWKPKGYGGDTCPTCCGGNVRIAHKAGELG